MKRIGFTLAELLITLSIIGVVAALTTPHLIQNVSSSRVGPTLKKAKTTFELATMLMLQKRGVSSITSAVTQAETDDDGNITTSVSEENFIQNLSSYLKGVQSERSYDVKSYDKSEVVVNSGSYQKFDAENGITYWINIGDACTGDGNIVEQFQDIPSNQVIGEVYVDINGRKNPNRIAADVFKFFLYNDGSLRPKGVKNAYRCNANLETEGARWINGNCDETSVNEPETCTGSIFDNDNKVIYD